MSRKETVLEFRGFSPDFTANFWEGECPHCGVEIMSSWTADQGAIKFTKCSRCGTSLCIDYNRAAVSTHESSSLS